MEMKNIPFGITAWDEIASTEHKGETGMAYWHMQQFENIRVRMVEYSPGYLANHWCTKGHILLCLEGELHTEIRLQTTQSHTARIPQPASGFSLLIS